MQGVGREVGGGGGVREGRERGEVKVGSSTRAGGERGSEVDGMVRISCGIVKEGKGKKGGIWLRR